VEQNAVEKQASPPSELKALEGGLKNLWDRVRQAGELIAHLREERGTLRARVCELESSVAELERTLGQYRATIRTLETQLAERPAGGTGIVNDGEREALAGRLKDLLARIDAYL
jgi:predicted  nucleic acid-binding Zn-ribbon protein